MKQQEFKKLYEKFVPKKEDAFDQNKYKNILSTWEGYCADIKNGLPIDRWLKNPNGYLPNFLEKKTKEFGSSRPGSFDQVMIYQYSNKKHADKIGKYIDKYAEKEYDDINDIIPNYEKHIQKLLKDIVVADSLEKVFEVEKSEEYDKNFKSKQLLRKITILMSLMNDSSYYNQFLWFYNDESIISLANVLDVDISKCKTFLSKNNAVCKVAKEWAGLTEKAELIDIHKLYMFLLSISELKDDMKKQEELEVNNMNENKKSSLNTILYGPPGTGKTYSTVIYAVAIIEDKSIDKLEMEDYKAVLKRYNGYKSQGLIEFTTFHQSYGYEEFIEGIKPNVDKEELSYKLEDGIFKKFCNEAFMTVNINIKKFDDAWYELIDNIISNGEKYTFKRKTGSTFEASVRDFETLRVDWSTGSYNLLKKSDIYNQWKISNPEERAQLRGGNRWLFDANIAVIDVLINNFSLPQNPIEETINPQKKVFIIDEINRGNISKIFGELITLIEDTKRAGEEEAASAVLPYSGTEFSVPSNVYILGTMNTADRSIALMDTALRRRFQFIEMMPDADVLRKIGADKVRDLDVAEMLEKINERISFLYDREHTIGHAFFTSLKDEPTLKNLESIFMKSIIPLLQEYFYEDYQKIQLVLGDDGKSNDKYKFIKDEEVKSRNIFKGNIEDTIDLPEKKYSINEEAFGEIESYKEII